MNNYNANSYPKVEMRGAEPEAPKQITSKLGERLENIVRTIDAIGNQVDRLGCTIFAPGDVSEFKSAGFASFEQIVTYLNNASDTILRNLTEINNRL